MNHNHFPHEPLRPDTQPYTTCPDLCNIVVLPTRQTVLLVSTVLAQMLPPPDRTSCIRYSSAALPPVLADAGTTSLLAVAAHPPGRAHLSFEVPAAVT